MRTSQRTKMVKPAATAGSEDDNSEGPAPKRAAESCSAMLQTTPTKRRRVSASMTGEAAESSRTDQDAYTTPTKDRRVPASRAIDCLLPTPPATPTISISPSEPSSSISSSSSTSYAASNNIYARARSLLRLSAHASCSNSDQLVGRTVEREQLDAFLRFSVPQLFDPDDTEFDKPQKAKALYISGSPGTGKTALLKHVLDGLKAKQNAKSIAFLNCTTVTNAADIWERIALELDLEYISSPSRGKGKQRCDESRFLDALDRSNSRCLVVLDEIDHLLATTTSSDPLSRLFAIALDPNSKLVLIGIANALDLTQRHLNLLADGDDDMADPELLHFRPFQSDEMVAIAKARLSTLHEAVSTADAPLPLPVVMPPALELAAKKVAAVTGDLRSFLSLVRKAVEIFEGEQKKRLAIASSEDSPTKKGRTSTSSKKAEDPLALLDALSAPKLTPAHILKAARLVSLTAASGSGPAGNSGGSSTTGSSLSATSSSALVEAKISDLNLHQRLALEAFAVSVLQKQARVLSWSTAARPSEAMKPGELHAAYRTLLEKDDMLHAVGSNEFSDLISGLHTRGLVGFERDYGSASSPASATLAPPMMRRTSSSSSTSSRGRGSRSPSPSAAQAPLVLLYSANELCAALRAAKPAEAAAICSSILNREEKRIRRLKACKEREEAERRERINAPREGFNGDGLDDLDAKFVGKRDKRGRDQDEEEEEPDHEEGAINAVEDDQA